MRAQDIIADFLAKIGIPRQSADDTARDLLAALERHRLFVREEDDGYTCPICGDYD